MTYLNKLFGNIDIYLFDQLLKGRFENRNRILDVGCGHGRNLIYFLQNGFDVHGLDQSEQAIQVIRTIAAKFSPRLPPENFRAASLENIPHPSSSFDAVICNAVLHFADNEQHFEQMLSEIWRVLKTDGLFFCRLASNIGIESRVRQIAERRYLLPDGSERFLVDESMLLRFTERLSGKLADPIKTSNVQNLRCMTTWCLTKDVTI